MSRAVQETQDEYDRASCRGNNNDDINSSSASGGSKTLRVIPTLLWSVRCSPHAALRLCAAKVLDVCFSGQLVYDFVS